MLQLVGRRRVVAHVTPRPKVGVALRRVLWWGDRDHFTWITIQSLRARTRRPELLDILLYLFPKI